MLPRYSARKAEKIIARYDGWLRRIESSYALPRACMQAVLYREITGMDWLDAAADGAVAFYYLRYRLRGRKTPRFTRGPLGKTDSSTGYAQIFARVAIRAVRFAAEQGIAFPEEWQLPSVLSPENPDHVWLMWRRLHRDRRFNLCLAALNLLSAGWEVNGSLHIADYTPEEMQRMFTRYNANTRQINEYGRETYRLYLRYCQKNAEGLAAGA